MIEVDGKFFAKSGQRFVMHGVTYGTFAPRPSDGARFPCAAQIKDDISAMHEAGFNTLRTYTAPTDDLLALAAEHGLHVFAGAHWNDWRYLIGSSRRQAREVGRDAVRTVRAEARRLRGMDHVLALCVGNEIPADVVRWVGTETVAHLLEELAQTVHTEDPHRLVTYANFPSTEFLAPRGLDFTTFNVFLERKADLRRYVTRLHNLVGDRPLVIGEFGRHVGLAPDDEVAQAAHLDEQRSTLLERGVAGSCSFAWTDEWHVGDSPVEGWRFGLTRSDRSPRPALQVAAAWNRRNVADLLPKEQWPSIAVIICAYNAAETLDECLRHTCRLDYEPLEILVVDDGSTDATATIAAQHPRVRLVRIEHAGLGAARNAGYQAASSEIVAYLDADAYPSPEWPYYLALGFDSSLVGAAGGPNVSPPTDSKGSQRIAHSPGGPAHVLVSDDRAEHIPGCNMAFWRDLLEDVAGFDPVYTAAGDDVDLCWRVLDRGWQISFHPAALVWHHRRPTLKAYLRQQRGYGRAEALVEARHPDRFTSLGAARWGGRIYGPRLRLRSQDRIYRGAYGAAAFQSIYASSGSGLDLLHQLGVPIASLLVLGGWLGFLLPWFGLSAIAGAVFLLGLFVVDARALVPSAPDVARNWSFKATVALFTLVQPLARLWGRIVSTPSATRSRPRTGAIAGPLVRVGNVFVAPAEGPRANTIASLVEFIRRDGLDVCQSAGWEEPDATVLGSSLVAADIFSVGEPAGVVQVRARRRLRPMAWAVAPLVAVTLLFSLGLGVVLAVVAACETARGWWRTGYKLRSAIDRAATVPAAPDAAPPRLTGAGPVPRRVLDSTVAES
jgi:glycosyltransferase involved in cell wall biosynthesis